MPQYAPERRLYQDLGITDTNTTTIIITTTTTTSNAMSTTITTHVMYVAEVYGFQNLPQYSPHNVLI